MMQLKVLIRKIYIKLWLYFNKPKMCQCGWGFECIYHRNERLDKKIKKKSEYEKELKGL